MASRSNTPHITLPDEFIEGVRQRLETAEGYQWELGDYLVEAEDEIIPHLSRQGIRYPRAYLIREIASRVGCDTSTLRDRASMARFYPAPIRQEYTPLTYYQLRACKTAGIDRWRTHAEWALANLPAPVAAIRAHVKNNGHLPPAWEGRWARVLELCEQIAGDDKAHPRVARVCRVLLDKASVIHL